MTVLSLCSIRMETTLQINIDKNFYENLLPFAFGTAFDFVLFSIVFFHSAHSRSNGE